MFFPAVQATENNPERTGNEYRRIASNAESDQQSKGKILRRISAEEIQGKRRKQNRKDRIKRARQRLENRRIDQPIHIAAAAEMELEVLANPVENNNGIIDGITDDGQKRSHKR